MLDPSDCLSVHPSFCLSSVTRVKRPLCLSVHPSLVLSVLSNQSKEAFVDWDRHDDAQDHFCEIDGESDCSLERNIHAVGLVLRSGRIHRRVDGLLDSKGESTPKKTKQILYPRVSREGFSIKWNLRERANILSSANDDIASFARVGSHQTHVTQVVGAAPIFVCIEMVAG